MSWIKTAAIAAWPLFGALSCVAGPKEFGLAQLNQALADRNLEIKITAEMGIDPPETFQIEPSPAGRLARITGGDLRGLMYGLIDAAEQIRASGKLARTHSSPTIALRGVRLPLTDADRFTSDSWRAYIQMLAISRFNRVAVVMDHFPSALDQRHLRLLAQTAADFAIDFILGLPPLADTDALPPLFAACPQIRGIEIPADSLPAALRAQHEAGRLISIDLSEITSSAPHGIAVRALVSIPIDAVATAEIIRRRLAQVDPTTGFKLDVPAADESPASLYRLWGRLAYSLKL